MELDEKLKLITRALVDEGKLMEAGWVVYSAKFVPRIHTPAQLAEWRRCFYAGAQHLFGSIMTFLDEGPEPTHTDLDRMSQIDAELSSFVHQFKAQVLD